MPEIVGTAYVRIRALTKGLSKEIKDGVQKGVDDAGLDDAGASAGDDFVEGFSAQVGDGIEASVSDAFNDDSHEDAAGGAGTRSAKRFIDDFDVVITGDLDDVISDAFDGDGHSNAAGDDGERSGSSWQAGFRGAFSRFSEQFNDIFKRGSAKRDSDLGIEGTRSGGALGTAFRTRFLRDIEQADSDSQSAIRRLAESFRKGLTSGLARPKDLLRRIFGSDKDATDAGERQGSNFVSGFSASLKRHFSAPLASITSSIKDRFASTFKRLTIPLTNIFGGAGESEKAGAAHGQSFLAGFSSTLKRQIQSPVTAVSNALRRGLTSAFRTPLNILGRLFGSDRDAESIGTSRSRSFVRGFTRSLTRTLTAPIATIGRAFSSGISRALQLPANLLGRLFGRSGPNAAGQSIGNRMLGGIRRAFSGTAIRGIFNLGKAIPGILSTVGGLFTSLSTGMKNAISGIFGTLGKEGEEGGGKSGKGFLKGFTKALKPLSFLVSRLIFNRFALIGGALAALAPAILQSVAGLGALLGNVLSSAVGGALAAAGGITALLGFGPVIASFLAATPMLELFKERMSELKTDMLKWAEAAQEQVLPAIIYMAETLTERLTPALTDFAAATGTSFADAIETLTEQLSTGAGLLRFSIILNNSAKGFDILMQAMKPFIGILLTFFAAVSRLGPIVAQDLKEIFERMDTKLAARGIDSLAERFEFLYGNFKIVMGGIVDFTIALYNLLRIGGEDSGQTFFDQFRKWAADFREFTESAEGIERIKEMFARATPIMREFFGVFYDLIKMIWSGSTGEEASNPTLRFLQWMRAEALPFLRDEFVPGLVAAVKFLWGFLGPVLGIAVALGKVLLDTLKPAIDTLLGGMEGRRETFFSTLKQTVEDLLPSLERIGDALSRGLGAFFEAMGSFISSGALEAFFGAIVAIVDIISRLVSLPGVPEFLGIVVALLAAFRAVATVVGIVGTVLSGIGSAITFITGAFASLGSAVIAIAGVFGVAITAPAALVGAIAAAVAALVYIIIRNWDTIVGFFQRIPEYIGTAVDWLRNTLVPAIGRIGGQLIDGLVGGIWAGITAIPRVLVGIFDALIGGLRSLLGIRSPSTVAFDLGGMVMRGLVNGLIAGIKAIAKLGLTILSALKDAFMFVVSNGPTLIGKLLGWFGSLAASVLSALGPLGEKLVEWAAAGFEWVIQNGPSLLAKFLIWYYTLPFKILKALGPLGVKLFEWIKAAFEWVVDNGPSILRFLLDWIAVIPAFILGALAELGKMLWAAFRAAFEWVVDNGPGIIAKLIEWSRKIPGLVLRGLASLGKLLVSAFTTGFNFIVDSGVSILLKLLEWAITVPILLVQGLVKLGPLLFDWAKAAFQWVVDHGPEIVKALIDWYIGIPIKIIGALGSLGGKLWEWAKAAFQWVVTNGPDIIAAVIEWVTSLPGTLIGAMASFGTQLWTWAKNGFGWVVIMGGDILSSITTWFASLPDKFIASAVGFGEKLLGWVKSAFAILRDGLPVAASAVFEWFKNLPQTLFDHIKGAITGSVGFIEDIGKKIFGALANWINVHLIKKIRGFSVAGFNPFGSVPYISGFGIDVSKYALGGIFDRPTYGLMGEAGKEVLLPLTNPARTWQLAMDSGLFDVLNRYPASSSSTSIGGSTTSFAAQNGPRVLVEAGAFQISAQNASANEVADAIEHRLDWMLTTRGDR